jgi:integrase
MSQLYRNSTYINKVRVLGNYSLRVYLPKVKLTIPLGIKDKKKSQTIAAKVNELEVDANKYPDVDFKDRVYKECNYQPKVEMIQYKFEDLFLRMIKIKLKNNIIGDRSKELLLGKKNKEGIVVGGIYPMHLRAIFGKLDIRDISPQHKDMLIDKLDKGYVNPSGNKAEYSITSYNMVIRNIMSFLRWLVDEENNYLEKLPFVLKEKRKPKTLPKNTQNNWIEPTIFAEICKFANPIDVAYFKVFYNTGLRLREIRTEDRVKHSSSIKVCHSIKRVKSGWQITVLGKGGKIARLPLSDAIKPYYDIVTDNPRASRTLSINFKTACRLSGYGHFKLRHLRSSFISNLSVQSAPPQVIKELSRHSDLKTTSTHYMGSDEVKWQIMSDWVKKSK